MKPKEEGQNSEIDYFDEPEEKMPEFKTNEISDTVARTGGSDRGKVRLTFREKWQIFWEKAKKWISEHRVVAISCFVAILVLIIGGVMISKVVSNNQNAEEEEVVEAPEEEEEETQEEIIAGSDTARAEMNAVTVETIEDNNLQSVEEVVGTYDLYLAAAETDERRAELLESRVKKLSLLDLSDENVKNQILTDEKEIDGIKQTISSAIDVMNWASYYGDDELYSEYENLFNERGGEDYNDQETQG